MIWNRQKIKDLGRVVTGKTPSTKVREYFDGEYLFVTPTDLEYSHYYIRKTKTTVTKEAKEKHRSCFIPKDSVIYTCIGTIGKIAIASEECLTNQQINSIIPNLDNNFKFIYYYLIYITPQIKTLGGGVATPIINKTSFQNIKIQIPPLETQQKIASVLSAYDDLIENNLRRIKLLEEAARLIYKEWFVRLRFPGHEHTRIVDGLPEGWKIESVGDILLKINRKKKIKKEQYLEKGEIPTIDQSVKFIGGYTNDSEAVHTDPLPVIVFGDHTRIIKYVDFPFASGADGTQLIYPKNKKLMPAFLYFSLKHIDLSNYAYARHFKYLKDQEILIPKDDILKRFNEYASKLLDQISLLRKQNQKLQEARDILLPRLMNGSIQI